MMSLLKWISVTAATVALFGCATMKGPSAEETLTGTWKPEGSVAVYEIAFVEGTVTLSGHSEYSGKRLKILESSWDGEVLRFTSYLASTDMKVVHENRITGPDTMVSAIIETKTGQPRAHTVVWKKVKRQQKEG